MTRVGERQREADGIDAGEARVDEREDAERDERDAERVAAACGCARRRRAIGPVNETATTMASGMRSIAR